MNCPNRDIETQDGANLRAQSGLPATKRRGGARSFFKWSAIGRGGLIGLFVIIAAIASSGCDAPSTASDTTPTPEEAYRAGAQAGESLKDSGRGLDHNLLQEAVAKAETEILGDSGMWDVSNSDIAAVCGYFVDIGKLIHDGEPVGNARNTLLEEAGLERSALFGAILTTTSSSQAFANFCAPFNGYTAGFLEAFDKTSEIHGLELDGSAFVDDAIDSLSASELTGNEASFNKGFWDGMVDGSSEAAEAAKGIGDEPNAGESPRTAESADEAICYQSVSCREAGLDDVSWTRIFQTCAPNPDCRLQTSTAEISRALQTNNHLSIESHQIGDGREVYVATSDDGHRLVTWMDKDGVVFIDASTSVFDYDSLESEILLRDVATKSVPQLWETDFVGLTINMWHSDYGNVRALNDVGDVISTWYGIQPRQAKSQSPTEPFRHGWGAIINGVNYSTYYVPRLYKMGVVFSHIPTDEDGE